MLFVRPKTDGLILLKIARLAVNFDRTMQLFLEVDLALTFWSEMPDTNTAYIEIFLSLK